MTKGNSPGGKPGTMGRAERQERRETEEREGRVEMEQILNGIWAAKSDLLVIRDAVAGFLLNYRLFEVAVSHEVRMGSRIPRCG